MPIGTIAIGGGFGTPLSAGTPSAAGGRSRSGAAVGAALTTVSAVARGARARTGSVLLDIVVVAVPGWTPSTLSDSLAGWVIVSGSPAVFAPGVVSGTAISIRGATGGGRAVLYQDRGF